MGRLKTNKGIPRRYEAVYQDYLASTEPYNLKAELALQRTLFVEARDALEQKSAKRQGLFVQLVQDSVGAALAAAEADVDEEAVLKLIEKGCKEAFLRTFPALCAGLQDFKDLSSLLDQVAKTAERMKKIQEGIRMQVALDTESLMAWLRFCVFPFIAEGRTRSLVMERAALFATRQGVVDMEVEEAAEAPAAEAHHPALGTLSLPPARSVVDDFSDLEEAV